jgi:hypothetical protein
MADGELAGVRQKQLLVDVEGSEWHAVSSDHVGSMLLAYCCTRWYLLRMSRLAGMGISTQHGCTTHAGSALTLAHPAADQGASLQPYYVFIYLILHLPS